MSNANSIAAKLADLKLRVISNYSATAKKHMIVFTLLMRCYTRKTVSNYEAIKKYGQALNTT